VSLGARLRVVIGAAGIAVAVGWAVLLTRNVERQPLPRLSPAQGGSVARSVLAQEPRMRARSRKQFPYDHWSQDDAFGALEQGAVRAAASRARADLGSVLDAVDTVMHREPSAGRKAGASPCKPRPFYD
jgi:hypothetical protein